MRALVTLPCHRDHCADCGAPDPRGRYIRLPGPDGSATRGRLCWDCDTLLPDPEDALG